MGMALQLDCAWNRMGGWRKAAGNRGRSQGRKHGRLLGVLCMSSLLAQHSMCMGRIETLGSSTRSIHGMHSKGAYRANRGPRGISKDW